MYRKIDWLIVLLLALVLLASACNPFQTPAVSRKPSIMLAAPAHGSEFREGDNVAVQSAATDAVGIVRVELSVDGALVRSDSAPSPQPFFPTAQNWQATTGTHTLTVRAYNAQGSVSDAAAVSVTVLPGATPTAAPPTPPPSAVPEPPTPVAEATPPPTSGATTASVEACSDNSELVIESATEETPLAPGQAFGKGWRLRNNGTCTWQEGYAFAFVGGEAMTTETDLPIDDAIAADETFDLMLPLTAPAAAGTYQGEWRFRNAGGAWFGDVFKVSITVAAATQPPAADSQPDAPPSSSGASPALPTLPPAATLRRSIPLLPPGLIHTPTWTPLPGFGAIPPRTPTWTPIPGFHIVPPRTPTWTPIPGFHIVPPRTPTWTPVPGIRIVPARTPTRPR